MIETEYLNKLENELCFKYLKNGKTEYREKIILGNYRLVVLIAKKYNLGFYELDDLISIGIIGLIKAVDNFKIEENIAFSTYAVRCINNEIMMQVRKDKSNISIFKNSFINYDDQDIIKEIEADINIEKSLTEKVFIEQYKPIINEALNSLTSKEKNILFEYYGINTTPKIQKEIALKYNVSRAYISKIILTSLSKIKKYISYYNDSKVLTKSKKDNKI